MTDCRVGDVSGLMRELILRLARAVDLMGRGRPLAEIAAEVGYAAPAASSNILKRCLGVPPSRFSVQREEG